MPEELGRGGRQVERIDWRKSVLLNLVIQATYCLTVATCRFLPNSSVVSPFPLLPSFNSPESRRHTLSLLLISGGLECLKNKAWLLEHTTSPQRATAV